jgi:hypothetical protein
MRQTQEAAKPIETMARPKFQFLPVVAIGDDAANGDDDDVD